MVPITVRDPQGRLDAYAAWLLHAWQNAQRRAAGEGVVLPDTAAPERRAELDAARARAEVEAATFRAAFSNLPVTESEEALGVVTPTMRSVEQIARAWARIVDAFPGTTFRLSLFYLVDVASGAQS